MQLNSRKREKIGGGERIRMRTELELLNDDVGAVPEGRVSRHG